MVIHVVSLFPEVFTVPFDYSILKRAQNQNQLRIVSHNLRRWGIGKHRVVDSRPYGGGTGMILRVDVLARALLDIKNHDPDAKIILLDPQGRVFNQDQADRLAKLKSLVLVCGHYEGVDERVKNHLVDEVVSIGDYVLTGGEIPAMVIIDAVGRLIPGVLEKSQATACESFKIQQSKTGQDHRLLEYPQYTRPKTFRRWSVPNVLLSGNHQEIEAWRRKEALKKTRKIRPDLLV